MTCGRTSIVIFLVLFTLEGFWTVLAQDETLVETQEGTIRGLVEDDFRSFIGVPFAQPPVGSLRWRSPKDPLPFTDVYNATFKRDDCVQPDRRILMSEDCLYLNVYTPRVSEAGFGTWPVMVFWYGGSFGSGGIGLIPIYNGKGIVDLTRGNVVVFSNYRLSALGFLGSDELAAENEDGSTGNFGLQDQRQALIWVQRNIAAFGGDPNRVLIFGESAGSWSVQDHLLLPKSKGLFHAAIMESGCHNGMFVMNRTQYNEQWGRFSNEMGCNRDPNCMRRFTWQELMDGTSRWWSFGGWGLRIDGVEISEDPSILLQQGRFTRVPVILGANKDEIPADADLRGMTEEEYPTYLQQQFGPKYGADFATKLAQVYTVGVGGKYQKPWFAIQALQGHETFTCAGKRNSRWMSPYTDVYHYEFQQIPGLINFVLPQVGVFHAAELVFTLRFRPLLLSLDDRRVSRDTVGYWTRLAAQGDPNARLEVQWPKFVSGSGEWTMLIRANMSASPNMYFEECNLWDTVSNIPPRDSFVIQAMEEGFKRMNSLLEDLEE